ncbi:MAG TPA: response regulator [Verrucomicrobiae bacterium]
MSQTGGSLIRKRVLVVDDDPSIRHMLCRILVDEGYAALGAAGGREGINAAAACEVDLVLLDLKMPGMNGQETLKELAALRPGLPVIIMTAFSGRLIEGDLKRASALFQKPLDFPVLLDAVKTILARPPLANNLLQH